MTDFKPFSAVPDEPRVEERTVAVVLSIPSEAEDSSRLSFRPIGQTALARIALDRLVRVEADELWLHATDPQAVELFGKETWPGVSLLVGDGSVQPGSTHLMLLRPFHPFLRASTISEAVRLFKMRLDIATLVACTRSRDALYDQDGRLVIPEHDERALYRAANALQIMARKPGSKSGTLDPYPFEVSSQEGFFVDSTFELDLAAAYLERRQERSQR
ncbi:MAG: hypothetical protein HY898_02700 [Deltaproteobacteria bacterium]|nr:hypothetical protein [Deltaproteobacteria bacterium]